MTTARYDGLADWYDAEFAPTPLAETSWHAAVRLLGDGPGRLLDVGCGTGAHAAAFAERGWAVTGLDVSEDMLRRARERGVDVVRGDAAALPFDDESFDAVVSMWTHTDVDDFADVVRDVARVLRAQGRFVYVGPHPCFVGPHFRFVPDEGAPTLHPGYRKSGRQTAAPGFGSSGLRAKVGVVHLPLAAFLQAVLGAGLRLETFEEEEGGDTPAREYPWMVALRCRR